MKKLTSKEVFEYCEANIEQLKKYSERIIFEIGNYEDIWVLFNKNINLHFTRTDYGRMLKEEVFAHPVLDENIESEFFKIIERNISKKSIKSLIYLIENIKGKIKLYRVYNKENGTFLSEIYRNREEASRESQKNDNYVISQIN